MLCRLAPLSAADNNGSVYGICTRIDRLAIRAIRKMPISPNAATVDAVGDGLVHAVECAHRDAARRTRARW